MKYIVFLGDGMADYPLQELGGKTPLDVASKPNIDEIASKSVAGIVTTVPEGLKPGSDVANLSAMGYNPLKYYTGRSPLEAVSVGVPLNDEDITFRVNLVTLSDEENYEDKTMIDYSSDEITTPEAHQLIKAVAENLDNEEYQFFPGFSYRHVLVRRNGKLTYQLTPPHSISGRKVTDYLPKGENSDIILEFMKKSVEILKDHPVNLDRIKRGLRPATSIWVWGEGSKAVLPSFESMRGLKGGVVSAVDLIKGIAISAELESVDVEGATGNIHTNFEGKAQASIDLLKRNDFVYIHVEAADECGHRGEIENKIKSIELIDQKIVKPVIDYIKSTGEDYKVLIMPDHPTPLALKDHVMDPVPFVMYDSRNEANGVEKYNEDNCKATGLHIDEGYKLMEKFIKE